MSITDRDKKILAVLAVLGTLAAYWFLLLSPKRDEVAKVKQELSAQEQQRDAALAQAQAAEAAQSGFASDYAEMIRLGKAIPTSVDMPSLLVQLDSAADGSHIDLDRITVGQRLPAAPAAATAPTAPEGGTAPAGPESGDAQAGGAPAASAPGQAVEGAAETAGELDTQTSEPARDGSVPVGGGPQPDAAAPSAGGPGVAGLDSVPVEFTFRGDFFDLAGFFHRLKRFVRLDGETIAVRGRLMTIDSFTIGTGEDGASAARTPGGPLTATVTATVYLAPKAEGATAGATPEGPAPQSAAAAGAPSAPPTATVQP